MEFELYDKDELSIEPVGAKVFANSSTWSKDEILEVKENNEDFIVLTRQDSKNEIVISYDNIKTEKVEETLSKNFPVPINVFKIDRPISSIVNKKYTFISNNPIDEIFNKWNTLKTSIFKIKKNEVVRKKIRDFEKFLSKNFN